MEIPSQFLSKLGNLYIENPEDLSATMHFGQDGLEVFSTYSQNRQHISVSENSAQQMLTMYFALEGTYQAKEKYCPLVHTIHPNQHILGFSPSFEGTYVAKGDRINSLCISMTEPHFKRLMINDLDCLQRFWEKVDRREEVDIAPIPLPITPQQRSLIHELQHNEYQGEMKRLFYESKVTELFLLQAIQAEKSTVCQTPSISPHDRERLLLAKEFIEHNMLEPLSMKRICKETGLNDFKLKKGFKTLFNTTVFEYLSGLRMQYARQLLLDTNTSIGEVAYTLGYVEPYSLTKAFKKHFGYLPSTLRK